MLALIYVFTAVGLLLSPTAGHAQIANVADAANRKVEEGLTASGEISWEKKAGNNDSSLFSGTATGYFKQQRHVTLLILRREFGQQKGVVSSDSAFGHLRHRYELSELVDAEAFLQADRDPFRRVHSRLVAGAGPRTRLYKDDSQVLYLGVAPMYEKEKLDRLGPDDSERINRERVRLSISLNYDYKIDDRLTAHTTGYYQPVVTDLKDRRVEAEASLGMHLVKHLEFKLASVVTHDSRPPIGIKPIDQQYKNTLVFDF